MKHITALIATTLGCFAAPLAHAADYHVTPAGNDTNDGLSPQSAFRSLAAACRTTPAGKHVIHISAGEYEESASCVLPTGVSLVGAGIGKTVFRWNAVRSLDENPMKFDFTGFLIQIKDSSDASISGLTIIGSLPEDKRAHGGILAHEVRNASIHDCEVKGLEFTGIWLSKATNSSVHHCRFDDCGHPSNQSCSGGLQIGELTDCTIHHNIIREHRGAYGIKTWMTTWTNPTDWGFFSSNKVRLTRVLIHDNDLKIRQQGGWGQGQPNMSIELWNSEPDHCEIYQNRINTCVSLVEGGKAAKTIRVHHNLFILDPGYNCAIEAGHPNMEIDHNVFRNGIYPLATWGGPPDNLNVHNNVFDSIEDIALLTFTGTTNFRFVNNIVTVKKDIPMLSLGKHGKASHDILIADNLFVKQDGPPQAAEMVVAEADNKPEPDSITIRGNHFWNWNPAGADSQSADPKLIREPDGDQLLKLASDSPLLKAGKGTPGGNWPSVDR